MPDPIIVQRMNAYRAALLRQEAAQMRDMAARWVGVERNLEEALQATLVEIARRQAAGEVFGRFTGPYVRLERYQALLRQVRIELRKFGAYTEAQVQQGIAAHVALGVEHSTTAIETLAGGDGGVLAQFNRLSLPATENMAAALQADAPVGQLLADAWPDATVRMTQALMNGVALGWNPRKTARAMREGLQAGALQRALRIARTEQLRAYRTASLENYRQSGVVTAYKRLAAKSLRTCIACLIADGRIYALEESFDEHPNGRCTLVPILVGRPEPTWETGRTWFERQPAAAQRQLLGPAAYEAWRAGAIQLEDLVERHEHSVWGGSLQVKSLQRALATAGAVDSDLKSWLKKARDSAKTFAQRIANSTPATSTITAQGQPLSQSIQLQDTQSPTGLAIQKAISAIERVHGSGQMPTCTINTAYDAKHNGWYNRGTKEIMVNTADWANRKQLTTVHEIGHFLDDAYLNVAMNTGNTGNIDPALQRGWMKAIRESEAYKRLLDIEIAGGKVNDSYSVGPIHIEYLLKQEELWARSYAQFIARRSQNRDMIENVDTQRNGPLPRQWSDKDFEPIGKAIEAIFQSIGWMKQ